MKTARTLGILLLTGAAAILAVSGLEGGALAAKNAVGKPSVKTGDPEAIWIWFDNTGWHLRGSTGKTKHTFSGYVRARGGMTGVKSTRPGLMKKMELESEGVRFEFEIGGAAGTPGAVEGFDWQQSGDECITLELKIDNKPQPSRVFVGMRNESPDMFPFLSCRSS